jgi:hypothetical protein
MKLFLPALVALGLACTPQGDPAIGGSGLREHFERDQLGDLWHNTGGPYQMHGGELHVRGARNKPLWLRRTLPRDVRIELTARSETPDGDIKVEVFGDGTSRAESESYTATSYVIIFGGWNNTTNAIARMDEHGPDLARGRPMRVEAGRTYRLKIERQGDTIAYWVDGEKLAELVDPEPLEGRGHDHFAFNNWTSDVYFDDLVITPL